ncbi:MAG: hypothetical protein U5L04_08085 [Trueperaceae bacterium]|nr:hypothetical protein [Trueperaceae bacterium]
MPPLPSSPNCYTTEPRCPPQNASANASTNASTNNATDPDSAPLTHLVDLPLGPAVVTLDRRGLSLGDRGGFDARWASEDDIDTFGPPLSPEAYRTTVVKPHLGAVFKTQEDRDPPKVTLNLASHQLIDDLIGWSKLNARRRR